MRRKGKEQESQERWEIARWMAWQNMLLSPNIKPVNKAKSPAAFYRFPWEKPEADEMKEKAKQYRITPEEEAELNRIMAEWEAAQASGNKDNRNE